MTRRVARWALLSGVTGLLANAILVAMYVALAAHADDTASWLGGTTM